MTTKLLRCNAFGRAWFHRKHSRKICPSILYRHDNRDSLSRWKSLIVATNWSIFAARLVVSHHHHQNTHITCLDLSLEMIEWFLIENVDFVFAVFHRNFITYQSVLSFLTRLPNQHWRKHTCNSMNEKCCMDLSSA